MKKQSSLILFASLFLSQFPIAHAQQDLFGVQIRASSPQGQDRWQLFSMMVQEFTAPP
jgi:hypothetical protein